MTTVAPPYRFHKSFVKIFSKSRVLASFGWRGNDARGAKAPSRLGRALVIVPALALLSGAVAQAQGVLWQTSVYGAIDAGQQSLGFAITGQTGPPQSSAGTSAALNVVQVNPPALFHAVAFGSSHVDSALSQRTFARCWGLSTLNYASVNPASNAYAQVNDVLWLSSMDPARVGNSLRFNFDATILVDATTYCDAHTYASAGIGGQSSVAEVRTNANPMWSGWDSVKNYGFSDLEGTFHVDVPMSAGQSGANGSESFSFYMQDYVQASGYAGFADAEENVRLESITLPDFAFTTPESRGVGVSFQSGTGSPDAGPWPTTSNWGPASSGNWPDPANWSNGTPNGDGSDAVFSDAIAPPQSVNGDFLD